MRALEGVLSDVSLNELLTEARRNTLTASPLVLANGLNVIQETIELMAKVSTYATDTTDLADLASHMKMAREARRIVLDRFNSLVEADENKFK
jgi:hypothetical protein